MQPRPPVEVRLSRTLLMVLFLGIVLGSATLFALSELPEDILSWGLAVTEGIRSAW